MSVSFLDLDKPEDCCAWDDFCAGRAFPSVYHTSRWARTVGATYGAVCRSVRWDAGAGRQGLVPLFLVRSLSGRRMAVSVPYAPYGGVLAVSPRSTLEVLNRAEGGPGEALRGQGSLIVRETSAEPIPAGGESPDTRVTMWMDLPEEEETLWDRFPAKVRNQVRKARKQGVETRTGQDLLEVFHGLYAQRMHQLGTPAHGKLFFRNICREFADCCEFIVAFHDGSPVAGVLDVDWGAFRVNLYGAADVATRSLCANNLVYWESLSRAIARGMRRYDFGRSLFDSGQYRFKKQWGATPIRVEERRLVYDPAGGVWLGQPASGPSRKLAAVWRRLPGGIVSALAPRLRRFVY